MISCLDPLPPSRRPRTTGVALGFPRGHRALCGGDAGGVFTSGTPTGETSAWSSASHWHGDQTIEDVSGPSASFCIAVDGVGNVLTTTAGMQASHCVSRRLSHRIQMES